MCGNFRINLRSWTHEQNSLSLPLRGGSWSHSQLGSRPFLGVRRLLCCFEKAGNTLLDSLVGAVAKLLNPNQRGTMDQSAFKPFYCQQWNRWMAQPVPMLNGVSPTQAAQTAQGRKLLDQLLALYDNMRPSGAELSSGSLDANIPSRYAKWKLGYGPGSATEFAHEEEIFNFLRNNTDTYRTTQRKEKHTSKLERKKKSIFIPRRCEVKGCYKRGADVNSCAKCRCAFYCGKQHQTQDWSRHKVDCKALRNLPFEVEIHFFRQEEELKKYPLNCFPLSAEAAVKERCFICHANATEVDIRRTECCNLPVCDNSHEYEMCSYSRDFCYRSHDSYTACARHYHEEHKGDWRECEECNAMDEGVARPFRATNRFCATPCLEKFLPQGSMLTFPCDTPGCASRMLPGHSGVTYTGGKRVCEKCMDA